MRLSTFLAVKTLTDNSFFALSDIKYSLVLKSDALTRPAPRGELSAGLFSFVSTMFDSQVKTYAIHIHPTTDRLEFMVESYLSKKFVKSHIMYDEIKKNKLESPITQRQLNTASRELLYLMEKKQCIKNQYPHYSQDKAIAAYRSFHAFYKTLTKDERDELNNISITLHRQTKTFKEVYRAAKMDFATAGKWLVAMLMSIAPDTVFTPAIEKDYRQYLNGFTRYEYYEPLFMNTDIEAETVFVSLMTYPFHNDALSYDIQFLDYETRLPLLPYSILRDFLDRVFSNTPVSKQLDDIYVSAVRTQVKVNYDNYLKYAVNHTNEKYLANIKPWLLSIINGSMFNYLKTHDLDWFSNLCANIRPARIVWGEQAFLRYSSFVSLLIDTNFSPLLNKLKLNIAFIKFFKDLEKRDFLGFLFEVRWDFRKEVLRSYLACHGKRADDRSLVRAGRDLFKTELQLNINDIELEKLEHSPVLFKPVKVSPVTDEVEVLLSDLLASRGRDGCSKIAVIADQSLNGYESPEFYF
ncbi:MAG: hypothetical protein Q8R24_00580 [Legionellaceae bacterium]|nr:hypothetical protein [Legionellaceae bacterium]